MDYNWEKFVNLGARDTQTLHVYIIVGDFKDIYIFFDVLKKVVKLSLNISYVLYNQLGAICALENTLNGFS